MLTAEQKLRDTLTGILADPDYFENRENENAMSAYPDFFYCRHMQPGTCGYEKETILADVDVIKKMVPTGNGKPVFVLHQTGVAVEKIKEKADGYIVESFWNPLDGWFWFKIMVTDDKAREAIAKGWAVSNAYRPLQWAAGGTKNNCAFQRELMAGEFTHLAIVPNPRYEGACIMTPEKFKAYQESKQRELDELHNSLPSKGNDSMLNIFNSKGEKVVTVDETVEIRNESGGIVRKLSELLNRKNSVEDETVDMENGEKMNVGEMKKKYTEMCAAMKKSEEKANADKAAEEKKNADDKAAKEAKEKEEKENAVKEAADKEAAEKAKKEEDEKRNSGPFRELENARDRAMTMADQMGRVKPVETSQSMIARGKDRY